MIRVLCFVLASWLTAVALPAGAQELNPATAAAAHHLEEKLIAPCCWRETLDIHQSPIADQLRREIRQRLIAGESAAAIEADLVGRYGAKLRATLPGSLGYLLFGAFVLGGLAILVALGSRRGRRAAATAKTSASVTAVDRPLVTLADRERQKYEDELDDDLAAGGS